MQKLTSSDEFSDLVSKQDGTKIFLLKHSTRCPISTRAMDEFQAFANANEDVYCAWIDVIEHRDVSDHVAHETQVQHESPQVFVLSGKDVLFHTSHHEITQEVLEEQK